MCHLNFQFVKPLLFNLQVVVKMYGMGLEFFRQKMEVLVLNLSYFNESL